MRAVGFRREFVFAAAGLFIVLVGCGGGGGGGGTEASSNSLWITGPSSSGTYQTDNPTVNLSGGSFVPEGAMCTGIIGTMPNGYQVAWSNLANSASGDGSFYLGCLLQVNVIWDAYLIPLAVGENEITVTATDSAGNTASDKILVNRVSDTTPPTIFSTYPIDGTTGIPLNTTVVVAFSEDMDTATINSTNLKIVDEWGNQVLSQVYYDVNSLRALITPQVGFTYDATYTATVTTGVKDAVGNGLISNYSFSFTTRANPDMTPPTVESVDPANGSTCAPTYAPVMATFNEAIDPATLDPGTFSLTGPDNSYVFGTVTSNDRTATFTPATALSVDSMYTAALATGITDLAGNSLAAPYSWSFSTVADGGVGTWIPTSLVTAVPDARRGHVAVWDGTEMIIAGGGSNQYGRYDPTTETWKVASGGPAVSYSHAVWTGSRILMWGPVLGYVFDPASDTWANISSAGQPSTRYGYTAVWTGTEMIIWGGHSADYSTEFGDGARYNPATNTWQPISMVGAPSPRYGHTAVWTGTEMIVWGGGSTGYTQGNGARYNPMTDTWKAMSSTGAPVLAGHVAVWTGSKMVVWGSLTGTGGMYDPNTNSWTATDTTCAPSGRLGATSVWTGTRMIIWGGWANNIFYGDGYEFDPVGNSWEKLNDITAPSARFDHTAVWTGTQMIIWAGNDGADLNTGGAFTP